MPAAYAWGKAASSRRIGGPVCRCLRKPALYGFNFMNRETIGLAQWLDTPPGRCLLQWEGQQFDEALADTFGYHALQLGLPPLQALANASLHSFTE